LLRAQHEDKDEEEVEVEEIKGPIPKSNRKRRTRKMREQLEDPFLRRSWRLHPELQVQRTPGCPQAAEDNPNM
jgi:hypothetical protein